MAGFDTMTRAPARDDITGVVLAGGRGRRMGGQDKGLVNLSGRPMVQHVINCLSPQVGNIVVSANRNLERYAALGYRVVPDVVTTDYQGPLAGIASALRTVTTPYLVVVPCDSPMIGVDLVKRLAHALLGEKAEIAVAHDGVREHPVFLMLRRALLSSLLAFLQSGERKVDLWLAGHRTVRAKFHDRPEYFINVNNRHEHRVAEDRLRRFGAC